MKPKVVLIGWAACALITALSWQMRQRLNAGKQHTIRHARKELVDIRTDSVIKAARRVATFRIGDQKTSDPNQPAIGGYPVVATGKAQDQTFAETLVEVLFTPSDPAVKVTGSFRPEVGFRLSYEKESVDLTLSFRSNSFQLVGLLDETGKPKTSAVLPMGNIRSQLLALTRESFPNDAEIAKLSEQ